MNNDRNISELEQLNSRKYLLEKQLNEMKNRIMAGAAAFIRLLSAGRGNYPKKS